VADAIRCPRCAAAGVAAAAAVSGMCPSCLLELALLGPDDPSPDESEDEPLVPEAAYRVVTILGADDSGTTYLAEQDRTRRLVTLHVVNLPQPFDEERMGAFRERASALGRLVHSAIQPIIDVRRTAAGDGCVVSPYVNGPQLARYCQSTLVDGPERARLFSMVCEAIAFAHGHGVCHGRLGPEMVVVRLVGKGPSAPVVVGFSVFPGPSPDFDVDLAGLESIARAMGWVGPSRGPWASIGALRDAACRDWQH
jgi:serine/threonine protein kinase